MILTDSTRHAKRRNKLIEVELWNQLVIVVLGALDFQYRCDNLSN